LTCKAKARRRLACFLLPPSLVKGITAAILVFVATLASAANISINTAFPSDSFGNPVQVLLGESFFMTAKLNVDAPLTGKYQVRFELPYAQRTTSQLNYGGQATVTWGPYTALLDGPTPMKVSVISTSDQTSAPVTINIAPVAPKTAIEYFAPKSLYGSVGASASLSAGTAAGLQWFAPLPNTGGFQRVLSTTKVGSQLTSTPFAQPVVSSPKVISSTVTFSTTASSSRINSSLLRSVNFSSYSYLPSSASVWLRNEILIQARASDITYFVNRSLPLNFRTTIKPYDAAQKLFQAVVAKVQYSQSLAKPDALVAVRTGKGDCGYFAALFVASCRNIGIPARTVCGMTKGDGQWHVWAEFWMPTYGWIPADPAFCDTLCPNGSLPLYFGTIPELNERVAVTYGFDHVAAGRTMSMLQSPVVFTSSGTLVSSIQSFCSLSFATDN
jgi:hypothetical protein